MDHTTQLRTLIEREEILIAPGVHDPYIAKCVQAAGFEAVYMTGAGVSHTALGLPDLGLTTFTEMVDRAGRIADAVDIPVFADADTGYGNALNVIRTVKAYERAGVAGLHIEDQEMPKKCGHFDRKKLIPLEEMLGLEQAIERAQAFAEVGVDMVFVESPLSEAELEQVGAAINRPLLANMVETGKTPMVSTERLQAMGYSVAIFPGAIGRFIGKQLMEFLQEFRAEGSTLSQLDKMLTFKEQNEIVGLPAMQALAERYKA